MLAFLPTDEDPRVSASSHPSASSDRQHVEGALGGWTTEVQASPATWSTVRRAVGGGPPHLKVDAREHALQAALVQASVAFVSEALDLGDAQLTVDACTWWFERKTLPDLAASIQDGRWREQKARLFGNAPRDRVVYIVESNGFAWDARMRVQGVQPSAVQTAVASSMLRDGIKFVWTRDVQDTAAFIARVVRKAGEWREAAATPEGSRCEYTAISCKTSAVLARKRDNLDARRCYLQQLCQLPGVSVKVAGSIAGEYGSMQALYAALSPLNAGERARRLAALPLIADKTAQRLCSYLFDTAA